MSTRSTSRHSECVAFLAGSTGLGRTAVVANLALILAGARRSVLIVDWSGGPFDANEYFTRFGVGPSAETTTLAQRFDALTDGRGSWRAARFQPPGDIGPIDLVIPRVRDDEPLPGVPRREPLDDVVARLRAALDGSGYDYVLMDAPTAPSDETLGLIARGADQAVVLFEPSRVSVAKAVGIAETIAPGSVASIRVLPLEVRGGARAERGRLPEDLVAQLFDDFLLDGDEPILRVPFVEEHVDRRLLVALAFEPDSAPAAGYARIAAEVTRGEVTGPPELTAELRGNYRAALGLDEPRDTERVTIVHCWPDRRYADWVRARLLEAGADGVLARPGAMPEGRAVWIVSPGLLAALPDGLPDRDGDLACLVGGVGEEAVPPSVRSLSLEGGTAGQAGLRLLGRLALVTERRRPPTGTFRPRFPGEERLGPPVTNVTVPRGRPFAGRVDDLARLRDRLLADTDGCEPYLLEGPPGIGKTETVLEYLRRFGDDYDLIWWIPARTPDLARVALAELAGELTDASGGDRAVAAVARLRTHAERWLLVYDDVDDLAALKDLIPAGGRGHALVTARTAPESGEGRAVELGCNVPNGLPCTRDRLAPIDTADAAALFRDRVKGLTAEDAKAVAQMLDGLPLALTLASAWLTETAAWLAATSLSTEQAAAWAASEYGARLGRHLAERDMDVSAAALEVTLRTLEDPGAEQPIARVAVRLLELCAWLAPEGVGHRLLTTVPFLAALEAAAGEDDGAVIAANSMVLDEVIQTCARFGLGQALWKRTALFRVHRSVQELLHGRMASAGIAETRRAQVLEALGRAAPPMVDGAANADAERFAELRKHLGPSGAADSTSLWSRRWLVKQLRFHYHTSDEAGARELLAVADRVLNGWPEDMHTGRLLGQMANVRRLLGDFAGAYRDGERALAILRSLGPTAESWTLDGLRGRSADLRGLGRFAESLGEIQGVYERFRQLFGDEHRETVVTRINLAESAYLMGQYPLALRTARAAWDRRRAEFGELDWIALRIARRVGDYQGALGDWQGARTLLDRAYRFARGHESPNRLAELEALRSLAVAQRCARGLDPGRPHELIATALRGLRALLGADHPSVLATELSYAVELAMGDEPGRAAEHAERCRAGFASVYGDGHPLVQVCRVDLGAFRLEDGAPDALEILQDARSALTDSLGEQHPWSIVAAVHEARALVGAGRSAAAEELLEVTAEDAVDFQGSEHPYSVAAEDTLQDVRQKRGRTPGRPRVPVYLDVPFI
ncbi:FxSxx-COOH system tetratricopeptide repeat protein [Actinomadura meridiana]|uniref:FxSxx-COOH system tetratricopeptide repeat protein n=1 Tax=Actinomadura meridiana TaxID=559626 RepID=A0ABP8BVH6_9ACTN